MAPRVLVVGWHLPYPPDQGGRIRSYHLLRALSQTAEVTLVCFARPGEERHAEQLAAEGLRVFTVPVPPAAPRWWHHLTSPRPLLAQQYASARMRETVEDARRRAQPDAAVVDGLLATEYRAALGRTPVLYAAQNVESQIYRRMLPWLEGSSWRRLVARGDCAKTWLWERGCFRRFSHVSVVSEKDREIVRRWNPRATVSLIPNGVDCDYFRPLPGTAVEPGRIVFTGDLSYPPNRDAVLFFAREVFPLVRRAEPRATWHVVGGGAPDLEAAVGGGPGVVLTGHVADVRPHVARAAVVVAPLRAGGGTRLKILEALAMARPVVSTTIGVEGLDRPDLRGVTRADGPDALAAAVLAVLRDPARAAGDAAAAWPALAAAYDWTRVGIGFQRVVATLIETRTGSMAPRAFR